MKVVKKKLSELQKPEKNVRIHSDKQIAEFARSVEMFGQIRPIVVDENNIILAGNGLYAALCRLGREEADCYVVTGLTEIEKKKLMLADNRIFNLGVDDIQAFDDIILELGNDFDIPGYDADLLETLTIDLGGADDMMSGYGLISADTKSDMQAASEKYNREDAEFAEGAEEITPASATLSKGEDAAGDDSIRENTENPEENDAKGLQRRFVVCPKCGERIWL